MFAFFRRLWHNEPARVVSYILSLVPLVFSVLTAFGVVFNQAQQSSLSALLAGLFVIFIGGGEMIRRRVTPDSSSRPTPKWPDREAGQTTNSGMLVLVVVFLAIFLILITL